MKLNSNQSGSWYSPVGIYSVQTFARGGNLRVTFRAWGTAPAGQPAAVMAPWHKIFPGDNMTVTHEAIIGGAAQTQTPFRWIETPAAWGGGTTLDALNTAINPWPSTKATSVLFRV